MKIFKLIVLTIFLIYPLSILNADTVEEIIKERNVEVFKTPSCGCCYGYVLFLEEEKFEVKQTDMESLLSIKKKHNIPLEMQSCHTTILGGYFIEGHVPIEAINKLLKEQPDIDGIALPGMPIGTPGMPGEKEEPYIIYQLVDGKSSVFMTI
jgi:hypothetical protein